MIKRLLDKVVAAVAESDAPDTDPARREEALRLATAVLMIDVARADHVFEDSEMQRVLELIEARFQLSPEAATELFEAAESQAEDLVSAHQFTTILHKHLDEEEKAHIIELLWQVAYADGELDKYEDSLVRKISDLLYVSRGRVMRLKHDAETAAR